MPDSAVPDPVPARSYAPAAPRRAERDRALFVRFRDPDDPVARDAAVERFLPLARQIAGRHQRREEPRVERVVGDLTRSLGHQPSVEDVAGAIGVEPEEVLEAMQAAGAHRATSLDALRGGADDEPGAILGDTVGRVEDGIHRAEQRGVLSALMRSLTRREREVIRLRFEHDLTQPEIGERIGVSQMQVSRIPRRSIARLREIATAPARFGGRS